MPSVRPRLTLLFAAVLAALAGCSEPQQEKEPEASGSNNGLPDYPVTWRFALEEIEGSVQHLYANELKERIENISDGNIELDIFPYGSLGTSAHLTELTQDGSVHLAFASPGHLADTIPEVGMFTLHYVLSDHNEVNRKLLASNQLLELFSEPYAEHNMKLLGFVPEGWMVWTANKPLRSPEDFDGLKIRTMTAGIASQAYRAYGADPQPTPYSQVYSDLQLQRIDGQANPVFAIEEMGFYEVQSTMTFARPAQFVTSVVSNREWYETLPDDQQRWLDEALTEVARLIYRKQTALNESRLQKITEDSNISLVKLTEEERERFREASLSARDIYVEQTGDRGGEILDTVLGMVTSLKQELTDSSSGNRN
ncbi:C4-dicarboxylate ABC transporter [Marinobacter sp. NP-4(2019)]|uniref:TRAP transporter substrate-binding protein DctP n=1 Tax=Marinobacter sp. NP-4(2019) TaxID=2488665 RepID=UPI000FC3CBDC|nr:TRAP transporter substrate-binding protein DctP [Marinobacter sp. NP-4(2019)]AZT84699.1 C4-dicarboxylate ABC transporter [Marinobacter sp. NP-4(2019)]